MKKKLTSLFLAFLMTFSFAANVSAQVAVDEAGVAGITINPIQSQSVGKPVSISGYAEFLTVNGTPELKYLSIMLEQQNMATGLWEWKASSFSTGTWSSAYMDAYGKNGYEFGFEAPIYSAGTYRVTVSAGFSNGSTPEVTEYFTAAEFTVESVAAPGIAAIILEHEGVDANQPASTGKNRVNLITETAKKMDQKAAFNGQPKSVLADGIETLNPAYWTEVLKFLNEIYDGRELTYSLAEYAQDSAK